MKVSTSLIAVIMTMVAAPGTAQVFDMGGLTATLSVDAVTQSERARAASRSAYAPRVAASRYGAPARAGRGIELSYKVTPALRRQTLADYVQRISRTSPEAARVAASQFGRFDYAPIYRRLIGDTGLRENDVADAVTFYTVLGWLIANHRTDDPDPRFVQALRRQIAERLAASPQLSGPGARGALGEEMKLLAVTLHAGWQSAAKEGNARRYSDGVAALFARQGGYDLRSVAMTDHGFDR